MVQKFGFDSHLSYNINKILSELIQEIIMYGYQASDKIKPSYILRFYNRIEQLYFTIKDIISEEKEKAIEEKTKEIMRDIQKKNRTIDNLLILEEIKKLYLSLLQELQDRQYFFRMVDYRNKNNNKLNREVFDSHNSYDTNKIISIQIMTIVGMGAEAGDRCDFLGYYRYFNRLDFLYFFVRPIVLIDEEELDNLRDEIINFVKLMEINPKVRTIQNLTIFSKNVRDFHKKIIYILQQGRYLFRIHKVKDKSLSNSSIFFESSVYGD